jgi:hypothetical protein
MKLKEYLDNLKKIVKENPKVLEFEVISAIDDEGNGYSPVIFSPTLGTFEDGEFEDTKEIENQNSICIN